MIKRFKVKHRLAMMLSCAAIFATACGTSTPSGPTNGGTVTLGIWQEPSSFLAAGITDSLTFSYLVDAVSQEGLLWYRGAADTKNASSMADYWAPDLATEVPTTANGDVKTSGCPDSSVSGTPVLMCVTWKLRQGVKWHDGSTFGPHDVCDTFQEFILKYGASNNPTPLLTTSGWDQSIACKEDSSAYTATVEYKALYGPYLSIATGVYGIIPASILDQDFAANADISKHNVTVDLTKGSGNSAAFKGTANLDKFVDGTGPFVFQKYTPGQEIDFVANNNYWDQNNKPHLTAVKFKVESGLSAELNDILAGNIQGGFDYRLYNLKKLTDSQSSGTKIQIQAVPDSGAEKVDLNLCAASAAQKTLCGSTATLNNYTADPVIRKAMLEGINRPQIIHDQAEDKTIIPPDSWMSLGAQWIADPNVPTTAYDPNKANSDLDAANYKYNPSTCPGNGGKGFRTWKDGSCIAVNLGTTNNNPSRVATESEIQASLAAIGIEVKTPFTPNLKPGQFFGAFSDGGPLYTHQFDMAMYTNTMSAPAEPDAYWAGYHADCGGSCPSENQIPSTANSGQGQNDTGEDNPVVDAAMDNARQAIDLTKRATFYKQAEEALAKDLPEIPLYQQVTVDAFSNSIQNVGENDLVWDYNITQWYCTNGNCNA